jgi:hypothetical protein
MEFLKSFLDHLTRFLVIERSNARFSSDFEWENPHSISRIMFFWLNESCVLGCKVGCKNSDFHSRWAKKTWFLRCYPKNSTRIRQTIMWSNFLSPNSSLNGPETTFKSQIQWKSCSECARLQRFSLSLSQKNMVFEMLPQKFHSNPTDNYVIQLSITKQLVKRSRNDF